MKKSAIYILVAVTLIFAAFVAGFYFGRTSSRLPVQISTLPTAATSASGKVNINTAGLAELMRLPNIDKALAQQILDYRTAHGEFKTVSDLLAIPAITNEIFENIRDQIILGG